MYLWTRESPLNFGSDPDSGVRIGVGLRCPSLVLSVFIKQSLSEKALDGINNHDIAV